MHKLSAVEPLNAREELRPQYDAFLATVGYELRATYAARELSPPALRRVACAFADRQSGSFAQNREWFAGNGFAVEQVPESQIATWTTAFLEDILAKAPDGSDLHLCVDISSMSRTRLACLLADVLRASRPNGISVDFVYSVAAWSPPSRIPEPICSAGAVLPFFAGWSSAPNLPIVVLVGLGYEPDKAVGAYEYLEAARVWTFIPLGDDPRYSHAVEHANSTLLARVPERQRISYRVDQPVACFGIVEAAASGLLEQARPVLLPFGPKIFALCCMLVACLHRDVPVWRISSGQLGEPVERTASGRIVALRARFEPSTAPWE